MQHLQLIKGPPVMEITPLKGPHFHPSQLSALSWCSSSFCPISWSLGNTFNSLGWSAKCPASSKPYSKHLYSKCTAHFLLRCPTVPCILHVPASALCCKGADLQSTTKRPSEASREQHPRTVHQNQENISICKHAAQKTRGKKLKES